MTNMSRSDSGPIRGEARSVLNDCPADCEENFGGCLLGHSALQSGDQVVTFSFDFIFHRENLLTLAALMFLKRLDFLLKLMLLRQGRCLTRSPL